MFGVTCLRECQIVIGKWKCIEVISLCFKRWDNIGIFLPVQKNIIICWMIKPDYDHQTPIFEPT